MATEDKEKILSRIPIQIPSAVRDETYNTVRDVEDRNRLDAELF